jgi:putative transcriptional regulator
MTIEHHPDPSTLMAYAAGTASEPMAIVIASHLEFCDACRADIRCLNAIGGDFMQSAMPAALEEATLKAVLDGLETGEVQHVHLHRPLPPAQGEQDLLPEPLARLIGGGLSDIAWRALLPGVEQSLPALASGGNSGVLRLLRAQPGIGIPEHDHAGTELTLVLLGELSDGQVRLRRGDIDERSGGDSHHPAVVGSEACICVIASEKPVEYKHLRHRLLQRFLRI